MIFLLPKAGLCNRLQAIDSSLALARRFGTGLHVTWVRSPNCHCRFRDLFEPRHLPYRVLELDAGLPLRVYKKSTRRIFSHFNNIHINQKRMRRHRDDREWFETLQKRRHIFINTFWPFYNQPDKPLLARFQPRPALQRMINSYTRENQIGVHVRQTDCKRAIAHSPLEKFVEQMARELSIDPSVRFFLSTDDSSAEQYFLDAFPGKISTHVKRSLDRSTRPALEDAVVDLYSLANCRKLIGSYTSSFSRFAAQINGIEQHIIYEDAAAD